jgi:hypothetical protein
MSRTKVTNHDLSRVTQNGLARSRIKAVLDNAVDSLDALDAGGTTATSQIHHVRAASTGDVANLAACSTTMDTSVTLVAGDRVLLRAQSNAAQNGIYVVGTVGSGTAPLTRATDWDGAAELKQNTMVAVAEGTSYANTYWEITGDFPANVGTTHQHFIQQWNTTAVLTADGSGRALMAANFFDEATATDKFADQAITAAKIKNATLTVTQLANDAVEAAKIKNLAVTEGKLAVSILTGKHIAVGAAGATVGILPELFVIAVADGNTVLDALTLDATYGKLTIANAWYQKNTTTGGASDAVQICTDAGGTTAASGSIALNNIASGGIVNAPNIITANATFAAGAHIYVKRTKTTDNGGVLYILAYRVA